MSGDNFATRVSGLAALAEPIRRELSRFVVARSDPVSRDQASVGVGAPRHTAKFHLERLVEEGLLDTGFKRLTGRRGPGAGRPTKLYKRSPCEVSVTVPERHYDLAGHPMARAIKDSAGDGPPSSRPSIAPPPNWVPPAATRRGRQQVRAPAARSLST